MAKKPKIAKKKSRLKRVPRKTKEQLNIELNKDLPVYEISSLYPSNFKSYNIYNSNKIYV